MKLVLDAFARHCAERPDDAAIVDPDRSALTWSELAVRVAAMRALIAARTAPGARVCVSVPSGSAFWIAVLAAASSGRMPCLLPDPIPGMIADRIPAELGADALLVNAAMVADSARMPPREGSAAEPIGAILLSSGTTGHSRFVVRSVEAIDLIARTLVDEGLSAPGDIVASCLPMAHAYGFEHAFLAPILAGARVHALGAFSLEKATDALAAGATAMPLVPITAKALAEARPSAPRLRCAVTAGTVLPKAVRTEFERAFGVQLVDLYGASELGTIWLDRGDGGRPVRGVEITLVGGDGSSGEIAVRSVCMLTGVIDANGLCQPATEDGCFRTGDLGARAPDGSLRVTGRIKLVFDVGGLLLTTGDPSTGAGAPSVDPSRARKARVCGQRAAAGRGGDRASRRRAGTHLHRPSRASCTPSTVTRHPEEHRRGCAPANDCQRKTAARDARQRPCRDGRASSRDRARDASTEWS